MPSAPSKHIVCLIGVLFVAQALAQSAKPPPPVNAPFTLSRECQNFIDEISSDYVYGWASSSTNPKAPNSAPVYVFYYYLKNHISATPTLFINGGPQIAAHGYEQYLYGLNDLSWLIFSDQRGTGCSSPYPTYDKKYKMRYLMWSAIGIAHDLEKVREHLNIAKWNIWGHSYGGIIAQRYVEQYPQSLQTVVAHAGVGLGRTNRAKNSLMWLRYEFQIKVVAMFLAQYPDVATSVLMIVRQRLCLPGDILPTRKCGAKLLHSLVAEQGFFEDAYQWNLLRYKILEIVAFGQSDPLQKTWFLMPNPLETGEPIGKELARTVMQEIDFPTKNLNFNELRTLGIRTLGYSELLALTEFYGKLNYDYSSKVLEMSRDIQSALRYYQIDYVNLDKIKKNLELYPELQFYVSSAEWDYFMPPTGVEYAVRKMGDRVHYSKLLGEMHASLTHQCAFYPLLPDSSDLRLSLIHACEFLTEGLPFSKDHSFSNPVRAASRVSAEVIH